MYQKMMDSFYEAITEITALRQKADVEGDIVSAKSIKTVHGPEYYDGALSVLKQFLKTVNDSSVLNSNISWPFDIKPSGATLEQELITMGVFHILDLQVMSISAAASRKLYPNNGLKINEAYEEGRIEGLELSISILSHFKRSALAGEFYTGNE